MNWFRSTLAKNRACVLAVLTVSTFTMVGGPDFAYAHQMHVQKEQRLQEISETLGIPVEKLRPDHLTLAETLGKAFGVQPEDPVKKAGLERLQKVLREHEEQLAANPYLPHIEAVKNEHAIHRIEGALQDILQLTDPRGRKALRPRAKQAVMRNLDAAFDEGLELPPLPERLPAKAQQRQSEMQREIDRIVASVRPIVKEAIQEAAEKSSQVNPEKIVRITQAVDGLLARTKRGPRFADRPLPLRRVEKKAQVRPLRDSDRTPRASTALVPAKSAATVPSKMGIAPEIQALAVELDNSPAKIFRFVHDNIDFDPKWGATKGSLGTYWERSGTAWEQAWLLRDLLVAAGVDARFEWGEVEIDTDTLMNLTGVRDPWRAGDLMTTAGVPIVLLTQGSQVIKAQMQHVWVKAFVDYIPNRGLTAGPGDSWIRMDPSIKPFDYAPGIPIYEQVQFSLGDYLLSGTELSPRRAFEESLWSYIRANNIDCTTLEQLKPKSSIAAAEFPYLPGTLRAKILQASGESSDLPAAFQEQVRVEVRQPSGASLLSWDVAQPDTFGQRLEIDWRGATPDDQAILDSYGGVFETPPYLVDLVPAVRLGGVDQAVGTALGSAEDVEIVITTTPPGGVTDVFVHQGYAGEPSVLVTAFGEIPQQLTDLFQAQLAAATDSGDEAAIERATLQMLGTTYFQNLGRDAQDIADWNWHRLLRLVSEGLVVQTGTVTTSAGGAPLSFERAERFVDFPGFVVGLFHARGASGFVKPTLELAGSQGSYLEGQVFDQVVASEGIAAVSALTTAQREGQNISRVDASNVDMVLAAVELSDEIESQVRQAVGQGQVAWIPESPITVNNWRGVGFVLADPSTGAGGYLLNGGFAGGAGTEGDVDEFNEMLGDEPWLGPFGGLIQQFFRAVGLIPDENPSTQHGDPVNLASGNYWRTTTDLQIPTRGLLLEWTRTYNSRSNYSGPLGHGWTWTYGEHLVEQLDGSVLYREDDGSEHVFSLLADGTFQAPEGKHLQLTQDASGSLIRDKFGYESRFDSDGRFVSFIDPNDNGLLFAYDGNGILSTVSDTAGRAVLTTTVESGLITAVTDLAGRVVRYSYNGGNLETVTDVAGELWRFAYDGGHNLIGLTDPTQATNTFVYDSLDRCIRHVDAQGHAETFAYSQPGTQAVVTDRLGANYFFEFDDRGRANRGVDPLGNVSESTWDEDNNRISLTDPRGGYMERTYDDSGNVLTLTDEMGQTTVNTWDPEFSGLTSFEDPQQNLSQYEYDTRGNIRRAYRDVDGRLEEQTWTYDSFGQIEEIVDFEGKGTSLTWDDTKGVPETITNPDGNVTVLTSDALGRVTETSSEATGSVTVTFNEKGEIETFQNDAGIATTISYDPVGRLAGWSNALGSRTIRYDSLGRAAERTDALGNTTSYEYDPAGNLLRAIDPLGNATTRVYDSAGRLSAQIAADGTTWALGYCNDLGADGAHTMGTPATDTLCEITDPLGNVHRREHNAMGMVTASTDPLGYTTNYEYDELGRRTKITTPLSHETRFEYDEKSRLTAAIEPNGARTEYTYDKNGNQVEALDALERAWTKEYNDLNQLIGQADPLGNRKQFFYDEDGNLERSIDAEGLKTSLGYEDRRVTSVERPDGVTDSFVYDEFGRREQASNDQGTWTFAYDAGHRLIEALDVTLGKKLEYRYDETGRLVELIRPEGAVEYQYNSRGLMVEMLDPVTGRFVFGYDALGLRTSIKYPNGTETETVYDEASRVEAVITRNAQGVVIDGQSYSYDADGNRIAMTDLARNTEHSYTYDSTQRLERWEKGGDRFEEYVYDLVGNRMTRFDETSTTSYDYDDANRLLSELRNFNSGIEVSTAYDWDKNGNQLSRSRTTGGAPADVTNYGYDALQRLISVTTPVGSDSWGYDPMGTRVRHTSASGDVTRFLNDSFGLNHVVAEYDGSGTRTAYYTQGPAVDQPLGSLGSSGLKYLHADVLGSITSVSSEDGTVIAQAEYSPFGAVESSTGSVGRFGYTGRELDPTGLMHYRNRTYDPSIGRFTTRDVFEGFLHRPSSQHDYSYVENSPTRYTDPTGNVAAQAMGIIFLISGANGLRNFISFLFPEIWASAEVMSEKGFLAGLGYAMAVMFYEMVLLVWSYIHIVIGWKLLANLRAATKIMESVPFLQSFSLLRLWYRPDMFSLAVVVMCLGFLRPFYSQAASVPDAGVNLPFGLLVVSGIFCVLAIFGFFTLTGKL